MIESSEFEVLDNKKVILHDIVDYDNNIANKIISEEEKLKIEKINEEFKDIIREGKLEISVGNEF